MFSIRAEVHAVLEALHIVAPLHETVYFYIDNQAALYALQSTSPMDCDLLKKCLDLIYTLERCWCHSPFHLDTLSCGYPAK
ncbi:hypothetical protein E2C01_092921 [Portunus trituberculatus]|uniref:RNase H type-1 domain-containing protein n=1 Tax=Portunus trituberculatus TaxID=210409 RepID=A0A5B7JHQ8_PORTR|nr:hypothetical protein [Portunus trituberculatus]